MHGNVSLACSDTVSGIRITFMISRHRKYIFSGQTAHAFPQQRNILMQPTKASGRHAQDVFQCTIVPSGKILSTLVFQNLPFYNTPREKTQRKKAYTLNRLLIFNKLCQFSIKGRIGFVRLSGILSAGVFCRCQPCLPPTFKPSARESDKTASDSDN